MRLAVIGDVSGHLGPFAATLTGLGVDVETGDVPADLTVIQSGDLVHRGEDSDEVVALAERLLASGDGRYIQVMGNHEVMHLPGVVPFFPCECSDRTIDVIRSWWFERIAHVAVGLRHSAQPGLGADTTLIAHAGVTRNWWTDRLGSADAIECALHLDEMRADGLDELDHRGFKWGEWPDPDAGPWCASAVYELYPSWMDQAMPFNQVHGHEAPYRWDEDRWGSDTPGIFRQRIGVDRERRWAWFDPAMPALDGGIGASGLPTRGTFLAIDPGFDDDATETMSAFVFDDVIELSLQSV